MSFFLGGRESAVPVEVKHIERLFLGGRVSDVEIGWRFEFS